MDFAADHLDLAPRYGTAQHGAAAAERIMIETVSPACAPANAAADSRWKSHSILGP